MLTGTHALRDCIRPALAGRKALVLGGGKWQTDLIGTAAALGIETVVADVNPAAIGGRQADVFVAMDTNDRMGLLALARRHGVHMVLNDQTDRVVPIAAWLNGELGLPGLAPDVARRFTNKHAMRQGLSATGLPMPRYAAVSSLQEAQACAARWGYPLVLKPANLQSSVGVHRVDSDAQLTQRFGETWQYAVDACILVEEFVCGTEITVESFVAQGVCTVLAISEKAHYDFNCCVARSLAYPPRFSAPLLARIRETAAHVVTALGLVDGISHAEYRIRGGVPFLVEVAARGGGNGIASLIVPHVSGIDLYAAYIARVNRLPLPPLQPLQRAAVLAFLEFMPGRVRAVTGLERVRARGLAARIELAFAVGETIATPTDDRNRQGYCICLGDTRDEVDEKVRLVKELVKVDYA